MFKSTASILKHDNSPLGEKRAERANMMENPRSLQTPNTVRHETKIAI